MSARVCLCGYTINKHCTSANTYLSAVVVNKKTRVQTQTVNHKRTARMNTNHMVLISFLPCLCALLGSHHLTNQTRKNHKQSNMPTSSTELEADEKESRTSPKRGSLMRFWGRSGRRGIKFGVSRWGSIFIRVKTLLG